MTKHRQGFTLIELLVTVSILTLITLALIMSFSRQRDKADDARAKADLAKLKIAFEDYYGDHNCYPPVAWFDEASDCHSTQFSPYLKSIPCDKNTGLPYVLETDATTCGWFKLYASFSLPGSDQEAISLRSPTGSNLGTYGVSSTNTTVSIYYDPTASSTPTPSSGPADISYYCSGIGNCTNLPQGLTCNPTWLNDANCGGTNQSKCASASTCN